MTTKAADSSSQEAPQGESSVGPSQSAPSEHQTSRFRNQVFKSGPLYISSKGIGWTSWKKRWFILTRTSLVFFRSDPSAILQKGSEMNLTLGGIDLNNSASVEVKVDKKLLTVFFPDGREGRAFTLKAETLEDLHEWKSALESALAHAPNVTHAAGQNGILKSEQADVVNGSTEQQKDKPPTKSMVIGRPILLALEDVDGSPSFLEKSLQFIEDYGVMIEGILRQAADVEEVHRRVHEYEQGKTEFSCDEDAHVIADCIKYILRELPSSPVPASCCNALLEAFRSNCNNRLNAMRMAILETFPEPNRRLLQRILMMMQNVASHKAENRMGISAVAACMSPLLLRPLLAGDCELENSHMDVAGDGSFQLLQAAAAANLAQAIIITLLEEYDNIFGEGSISPDLFSNSDESGSGTEGATDDDEMYEDDDDECTEDDDHEGGSDDHDESDEHFVAESCSSSGDDRESDSYDDEQRERSSLLSRPSERVHLHLANERSLSDSPCTPTSRQDNVQSTETSIQKKNISPVELEHINISNRDVPSETSSQNESVCISPASDSQASTTKFHKPSQVRHLRWERTSARKNLSMESIDFSVEDEDEIEWLEAAKVNLQNRIAKEAGGNAKLQASLERRKKALHERRLALEKDVARLQEQLQKERDIKAALESGRSLCQVPVSACIDQKTKAEIEEIALAEENFNNLKQRLDDVGTELNHHHKQNAMLMQDGCIEIKESSNQGTVLINHKGNMTSDASHHSEKLNTNEGQRNQQMGGVDHDNDRKDGAASLSNKYKKRSSETSKGGSSRFGWRPSSSSSLENPAPKHNFTSRKYSKAEGGNYTASALSKLSNRLNFLKERRSQIASEIQNHDLGHGSSSQHIQNPGKSTNPDSNVVQNIEKSQGPEDSLSQSHEDFGDQSSYCLLKDHSTGVGNEDNDKEGNNKNVNRMGIGSSSKSDTPSSHNLNWKSENKSNQHAEKVQLEGQS